MSGYKSKYSSANKAKSEHCQSTQSLIKTSRCNVHNTKGPTETLNNSDKKFFNAVYHCRAALRQHLFLILDVISLIASILLSIYYFPIILEVLQLTLLGFPLVIFLTILVNFCGQQFNGMGSGWFICQLLFCLFVMRA